ncbi:dTDP-4-dehydrorhamnose reductase [Acidicapsa dinghuensis]|uniref:dTDP-4-dehydrorhamnose reductase n=1 Tax=Acidicapsa dinghuensis TaxID=2218256 RepID=A0ABW1EFZ4_9BACT|nr:dTDP-4-dehydrorhamnose reductase [Acidicapsa dinghuensis]
MPRILLLGAGGQLGKLLERKLQAGSELIALTHAQLDLADADAVREAVRTSQPEILINAAAYTAVDRAEQEQDLAHRVNAIAPGVMAQEMAALGGWLIHYSTDYVFDGSGTKPWVETDETGPLNVYGQSKLDGEKAIADARGQHIILRTSWVYAAEGKNFLHTMLRLGRERSVLKVVDDQIGAPTTAEALTDATAAALRTIAKADVDAHEIIGTYHLSCAGETSWCGFAKAIFAEFASRQAAPEVVPIPTEAFPTPAQRPRNSRLCCDKFAGKFGYRMPEWRDALHNISATLLATN